MKILIDQNISFRLVARVQHKFPDIAHLKTYDLINANDYEIFQFARANNFVAILTLDEDFHHLQLAHGIPPKLIWLRTGNCSTQYLAETLFNNKDTIYDFLQDKNLECIEILK